MRIVALTLFGFLALAGAAQAQDAVTATCKDGSTWSGATKSGACRGHHGVQTYGTAAATAPGATEAANPPPALAPGAVAEGGGPITATCKDGTAWSGATKRGACRGHRGVQAYGTDTTSPASPATTPAATPVTPSAAPSSSGPSTGATSAQQGAAAPAATTTPVARAARPRRTTPAGAQQALAPGGGNGQVWVNSATKVYHCATDPAYGRTKAGSYMTEEAAKSDGARPSRGKVCS